MRKHRKSKGTARVLLIVLLFGIVAAAGFAFTNTNTIPGGAPAAGDGAAAISGYSVTNIDYVVGADPANIESYTFTLSGPATLVKAKLVAAQATYDACTPTIAGLVTNVVCTPTLPIATTAADNLRVIAFNDDPLT